MASRLIGFAFDPRVIVVALAAGLASASGAAAQSRCEGTLCDLYYDHLAPAQQAAPAAPSPTPPAPAKSNDSLLGRLFSGNTQSQPQQTSGTPSAPHLAVQGGGLLGMMTGAPQQRCTGTLCDLYYGGPPPEEPSAPPPPAAAQAAAQPAADEPTPDPDAGGGVEPREATPRCTYNPRDPWQCYR